MKNKINTQALPSNLLTSGDVGRYCQTNVSQVNRWIKNNELKAFRYPGGHYRITKEEFKSFLERNGIPVIEDFFEDVGGLKILIADDDPNVVDAILNLLTKHDKSYRFETANDGYEALLKAGTFKPDIVILDIRMPKIDGLEICKRIRHDENMKADIKILAITGHSEAYSRDMVIESGANEYLLKPFDMKSILNIINNFYHE
ncbi:MAG: response regulator [Candidatus Latescibacteria bacterium]|jgi:excisionase family DNA binding protein|nr:response regulator [Candidatus Latescibacterota bacterium]